MPWTMFNRNAEVIVVGQVDTLVNFYPNMVRFRIRPDFFLSFFFFFFFFFYLSVRFFSFVAIAAVQTQFKICVILEICLFLMLSSE